MVLAGLQAQWRPLRAALFPQLVLLDLSDPQLLIGQSQRPGKPAAPTFSAPIPARTCRDGLPIAVDAIGDFIGDLLLEHSQPDSGLVVALPRQVSHWRVVVWPDGEEPEDAAEVLREEGPDLGWPFPLAEATLAVQPLPGAPGCSLVVGTSQEAIESWIEVFAIAGGSLRHCFPAQACLHRALQPQLEAADGDGLLALVEPGSEGLQLLVWHRGVPAFEQRGLPLEPEALTSALARCLGFCRSRLAPGAPVRLLVADPVEGLGAAVEPLGLKLELLERGEYGSLHLAGLAALALA